MLTETLLPGLKAQQGHVRSRGAWTASQFGQTIAKDAELSQQMVQGVLQLLQDPDFAVRFQAAVALRNLIYDSGLPLNPKPSGQRRLRSRSRFVEGRPRLMRVA